MSWSKYVVFGWTPSFRDSVDDIVEVMRNVTHFEPRKVFGFVFGLDLEKYERIEKKFLPFVPPSVHLKFYPAKNMLMLKTNSTSCESKDTPDTSDYMVFRFQQNMLSSRGVRIIPMQVQSVQRMKQLAIMGLHRPCVLYCGSMQTPEAPETIYATFPQARAFRLCANENHEVMYWHSTLAPEHIRAAVVRVPNTPNAFMAVYIMVRSYT